MNSFDLFQLAQSQIRDLTPYQPGMPIETLARDIGLKPDQVIKLASNENPDGASPDALEAARQALANASRYPDGYLLHQKLATRYQLHNTNIVLGNGSNDILDLIARVFLGPDTNAISSQYAFSIYKLVTGIVGAQNIITPAKNYSHDLDAIRKAISDKTRVVWLANPNNPTGTFMKQAVIKAFLKDLPNHIVVVLDEAYNEYLAPEDQVETSAWIADHPQLIVVRTFSKIYGLAGFRVGYALASPEVADLLNRVRQPFNVSHIGIAAALAALGDNAFIQRSYEHNRNGLQQLRAGLSSLGINFLPSYGNFITIEVNNAQSMNEQLLRKGIIVRPLREYDMPNHLRISVGTLAENDKFLETMRKLRDQ